MSPNETMLCIRIALGYFRRRFHTPVKDGYPIRRSRNPYLSAPHHDRRRRRLARRYTMHTNDLLSRHKDWTRNVADMREVIARGKAETRATNTHLCDRDPYCAVPKSRKRRASDVEEEVDDARDAVESLNIDGMDVDDEWKTLSVFKRGSWREASRSPPQGFLRVIEAVEDDAQFDDTSRAERPVGTDMLSSIASEIVPTTQTTLTDVTSIDATPAPVAISTMDQFSQPFAAIAEPNDPIQVTDYTPPQDSPRSVPTLAAVTDDRQSNSPVPPTLPESAAEHSHPTDTFTVEAVTRRNLAEFLSSRRVDAEPASQDAPVWTFGVSPQPSSPPTSAPPRESPLLQEPLSAELQPTENSLPASATAAVVESLEWTPQQAMEHAFNTAVAHSSSQASPAALEVPSILPVPSTDSISPALQPTAPNGSSPQASASTTQPISPSRAVSDLPLAPEVDTRKSKEPAPQAGSSKIRPLVEIGPAPASCMHDIPRPNYAQLAENYKRSGIWGDDKSHALAGALGDAMPYSPLRASSLPKVPFTFGDAVPKRNPSSFAATYTPTQPPLSRSPKAASGAQYLRTNPHSAFVDEACMSAVDASEADASDARPDPFGDEDDEDEGAGNVGPSNYKGKQPERSIAKNEVAATALVDLSRSHQLSCESGPSTSRTKAGRVVKGSRRAKQWKANHPAVVNASIVPPQPQLSPDFEAMAELMENEMDRVDEELLAYSAPDNYSVQASANLPGQLTSKQPSQGLFTTFSVHLDPAVNLVDANNSVAHVEVIAQL